MHSLEPSAWLTFPISHSEQLVGHGGVSWFVYLSFGWGKGEEKGESEDENEDEGWSENARA